MKFADNANVGFVRPEVSKMLPLYNLIRDVIAGEVTVKAAGELYLPKPNKADTSAENKARYAAYVERAVFYNVARRTIYGYLGQVFATSPDIKVPLALQPVVDNASGGGVSLEQLAKKATLYNLAYSRGGVFVDYPETEGESTVEELNSGSVRPTITVYPPTSLINWRVTDIGAEEVLTLVVIFETFVNADDGFELKNCPQFRVLYLDEEGEYCQATWREPIPNEYKGNGKIQKGNYRSIKVVKPTDAAGKPFDRIPFTFFGADNNDAHPDNPSYYDMCSLNIAHYRNSADYEEACFIVGQPTIVASGLTKDWVEEVLKGELRIGSRGVIPLPVGGDAKLIQAEGNTMIKEAMDTKEKQMIALGAKLAEKRDVQRTATESKIEQGEDNSILASSTNNVSAALTLALQCCAKFVGVPSEGISYKLSTDFAVAKLSPEELRALLELWAKSAISFTEMRTGLRLGGVEMLDDIKAKAEIDEEKKQSAELAKQQNPAGTWKQPVA